VSEPQIISTTDHYKLLELAERYERDGLLAEVEWEFLQRYLERLELEQPEAGFEDRWT
jgi:hypothetical protein